MVTTSHGQTNDIESLLRRAGAGPGRPFAAVTADASLVARLAGAAAVLQAPFFPVDPALPAAVRQSLLAQASVCLAVADEDQRGVTTIAAAEAAAAVEEATPKHWPPPSPHSIALLIATSGSSGEPKAVMLTHANLAAAARASAARTPLAAGDRWLACLPLFHIGGFSILTRCTHAGATAVLASRFDPEAILARLREERISHVSLVPVMLARLLEASRGEPAPATLRHALVGGASLAPALAEEARALGWPIQPTYGMSETASQVATLSSLPRDWRAGHVGAPLPGIEVAIDAEQRLMVRGPVVMAGYANPELRPGDGLSGGWLVTSDIAQITAAGELVILGRADDVIVSGGKKVHPAAVEAILARCPGVAEVRVSGRPHPAWGETLVAIYRGTAGREQLLSWVREHVSSAWRPRLALRVETLPMLANGKPDRSALRRLAEGLDAETGSAGQL